MLAGKASQFVHRCPAAGALFVLQLLLAALIPTGAAAQLAPEALRLMPGQPRPEIPADGQYLAGEDLGFTILHRQDQEELRFDGDSEVFFLTIEPAPLGGRAFKYDTGDLALQVTGWGGVTLYTRDVPGGVPAERVGDATDWDVDAISTPEDVKAFAKDVSSEISNQTNLVIGFKADWNALAQSEQTRKLACETIRNVARAIENTVTSRKSGDGRLARFDVVRIVLANERSVSFGDKLLTVTFAPALGPAGRPSSLAIARAIRARL